MYSSVPATFACSKVARSVIHVAGKGSRGGWLAGWRGVGRGGMVEVGRWTGISRSSGWDLVVGWDVEAIAES